MIYDLSVLNQVLCFSHRALKGEVFEKVGRQWRYMVFDKADYAVQQIYITYILYIFSQSFSCM